MAEMSRSFQEGFEGLKSQIAGQQNQIVALQSENLDLRNRVDVLQTQNAELHGQVQHLRFDAGHLRQQLHAVGILDENPEHDIRG
jgi:chromosome segregation ATPase